MRAMERVSFIREILVLLDDILFSLSLSSVSSCSEHPGARPHLDEESKVCVLSCIHNFSVQCHGALW